MADNVVLKDGAGTNFTVATDDLTDGTLGAVEVQFIKVMDGTLDSTNKWIISAAGEGVMKFASAQPVTVSGTPTVTVSGAIDASGATVTTNEQKAATSAVTSVSASASSVQLLASNANRKQAMFYNDGSVACYLKLGTTASTTSFTIKMDAGGYYEVYGYTGRIDGIWSASPTGSMRITELTP